MRAVVTEPTDLQIGVGHKGFAWLEVETRGRAAHGSRPRDGRDAILRMGRVLARLERLDRELQARPPHPLLGTGVAARVDHRRRPRVEQLSRSLPAADWSGGRSPARREHAPIEEIAAILARLRDGGSGVRGVARG